MHSKNPYIKNVCPDGHLYLEGENGVVLKKSWGQGCIEGPSEEVTFKLRHKG